MRVALKNYMYKKVISYGLLLGIGMNCVLGVPIYAENDKTSEPVQTVLEEYFDDFFDCLLSSSHTEYTKDDFTSINGYMIAKQLVSTRETYKKLMGGIQDVNIEKVYIEELSHKGENIEATVCINYEFSYGNGSKEEPCKASSFYRVLLKQVGKGYEVIDIDSTDMEIQKIKDMLERNSEKATNRSAYQQVDDYFVEIQEDANDLFMDTQDKSNRCMFKGDTFLGTNAIAQCIWMGYKVAMLKDF